jgi:hypothetical protein
MFSLAKRCVKIACRIPANRTHVRKSVQLREDFAGHPLHPRVLHRPTGTGHINENAHWLYIADVIPNEVEESLMLKEREMSRDGSTPLDMKIF